MKKIALLLIVSFLTLAANKTFAQTNVGGNITSNTTWTLANSPYNFTSNINLAVNITLIIEPGVVINGNDLKLTVFGNLNATGNSGSNITFNNVNIAGGSNSTAPYFSIIIRYAKIEGGNIYSSGTLGYGSLILSDSKISNLYNYMYIWYPANDCYIERNVFINSAKISIGTWNNTKIYVRNNVFYKQTDVAVENWNSNGTSETIVEKNSFISTDRIAVKLPPGYTGAKMTAINNYWNTTDTNVIASMIYDINDDFGVAGAIPYKPFLSDEDTLTPIQAFFEADKIRGVYPLTVQFSDASAGNIIGWNWDFGDGTHATDQNPTHIYTYADTFSVKLKITNNKGVNDIIEKKNYIDVGVPTSAGFTVSDPRCVDQRISFTDTSTGSIIGRTWVFDGIFYGDNSKEVYYNFKIPGSHLVKLIVKNHYESDTLEKTVVINALPNISAGLDKTICSGDTTVLKAVGGVLYTWNINGLLINSDSVVISPVGTGDNVYFVKGTDANACVNMDTIEVTVKQKPTSAFTSDNFACGSNNLAITYTGNAADTAHFTWDFDGAIVASGSGIGPYQVNWSNLGAKNITLSVSENGCFSTETNMPITVYQIPTSVFSVSPASICRSANTTLTYTGNASAAANYTWALDGGSINSGSGQGPCQAGWTTGGTKNVGLTVVENNCSSDNTTHDVFVQAPFEGEKIAVATFDTAAQKNLIVWKKTPGKGTKYFNIYKLSTSGYIVVGTVLYGDRTAFVDTTTNPMEESAKYKISVVDTCEQESPLSDPHKTMLLTSNVGTAGEVNLIWQHYEGFVFPKYYIYRGTSPNSLTLLKEVAYDLTTTSTKDLDPPVAENIYYLIGVDMPSAIDIGGKRKGGADIYSQSVSNLEDNRIRSDNFKNLNAGNFDLSCYPNPYSDFTTISYNLQKNANVTLELYNIVGVKIAVLVNSLQQAGYNQYILRPAGYKLTSGIYLLVLKSGNSVTTKRLVELK